MCNETFIEEDLTRYREKLKITTGEQLSDPYTLKEKWMNDISNIPEITWTDVISYLLDTSSGYTKKSIKAYKTLEVYNYFVCRHVKNCYYQVCVSSLWVLFRKLVALRSVIKAFVKLIWRSPLVSCKQQTKNLYSMIDIFKGFWKEFHRFQDNLFQNSLFQKPWIFRTASSAAWYSLFSVPTLVR